MDDRRGICLRSPDVYEGQSPSTHKSGRPTQEPDRFKSSQEAWKEHQNPCAFMPGSLRIPLLAVLLGVAFLLPVSASAASSHTSTLQTARARSSGTLTAPVTGTSPGGTFSGTLTVTKFVKLNHTLNAVGTLSGTLTSTAGTVIGTVTNVPVTIPISAADPATCTILTLHTGAIDLNLLGLVVHISPIDITITAVSGPGNLLGNLLCAIANLLNGGGPLTSLRGLLNQILARL